MEQYENSEAVSAEEGAQGTAEPEAEAEQAGDVGKLRREAAGYRTKLREAEQERDTLRERVERHERGQVEQLAGEWMGNAADLWLVVSDLGELRNQDGELDTERVKAAVDAALADRPHWRREAEYVDLHGGARDSVPAPQPLPHFGEQLKRAVGGGR